MTLHPSLLKRHQRRHTGDCTHQCSHCGKAFVRKSHLVDHLRVHTGERPFQCSHCGKAFVRKGHLDVHLRIHTGERPHQCHLCPSAFAKKNTLDRHVRIHRGEKPFRCRFCPTAFTYRLEKKAHEEREHCNQGLVWHQQRCCSFFCASPFCWCTVTVFISERALTVSPFLPVTGPSTDGHRVQHGPPLGRRLLRCHQFSYVTPSSGNLNRHQRTHTSERPYECSHCGKAFLQKCNLDVHLRIHTGERPYQCHLCPKTFAQRGNLAGHVRTHMAGRSFR
ncbi:uncharacterized protein LOC144178739 [Haemaphysalis longicornis]